MSTTVNCLKHQRVLEIYCESCGFLICSKCLNDHKTHHTTHIDDYINQIKDNSPEINKIKFNLDKSKNNLKLEELKFKIQVEDQYHRQLEILDKHVREIIDSIQLKQVELRQELKSYYDENIETYTTRMSEYQSNVDQSTQFIQLLDTFNEDSDDLHKINLISSYRQQTKQNNNEYFQYQIDFNDLFDQIKLIHLFPFINESDKLGNNSDDTVIQSNKPMNRKQLLLKSIELDHLHQTTYLKLGRIIGNDEVVELSDGRKLNRKQILVESINLNPNDSCVYRCLGSRVKDDEIIALGDGRKLNKKQLFIESIKLNPIDAFAYCCLGEHMSNDEIIELLDSRKLNRKQMLIESIKLDPMDVYVYNFLGQLMKDDEIIELADGRKLNSKQLFLESIKLKPVDQKAYRCLSERMKSGELIELPDGRKLHKRQLLLEPRNLNPNSIHPINVTREIKSNQ